MIPVRKTIAAYHRAKLLEVGHPRSGGSWWWTPAGNMRQIGDVRDGSANSITQGCFIALTDGLAEAPVQVTDRGEPADHPLPDLVENPNPYMTADLLWHYYIWATRTDGNAYLYKTRSAAGRPVELWPLRPDLIEPHAADNPTEFVDYYSYRPQGLEQRLDPADVIHLRIGLDPTNHRRGYGPLKSVLKEILADEEASRFATALLANMAIPGVLLTPPPGELGPNPAEVEAIQADWEDRFGSDRRGAVGVMSNAVVAQIMSFSPEQLNFEVLRRVPEERICSVLRVPAIVAGMGAGLTSSSGRSESVTLTEYFTRTTLAAEWRRIAAQLTNQLLPDYGPPSGLKVGFDLTRVAALQADIGEIWARADAAVRNGWLTVAEAKIMVGVEPADGDDVYLRSIATETIPV